LALHPSALPDGGRKAPTARMPAVARPRARPPSRPVSYAAPPRQPTKSRTGQWVAVVVLVTLLIAVGLLAVWTNQNQDGTDANSATGTAGARTAAEPGMVFIDSNAYRGQPVEEVEAALTDLGLVVNTEGLEVRAEALAAAGIQDQPFDKNDVVNTDPTQTEVPVGSTVTVYFAKKDYEPAAGDGNGDGNGNGNGDG
ncbi:MAG: PASTA domain-containing protein, partial [Geodermatophilaceae bacterium]